MDLRISGNFRPSGRIAARRIQSLFAFYSPVRFCYCAEEFVKRAFDTSDPDAQSSANPVTWIDGVVQHDWGLSEIQKREDPSVRNKSRDFSIHFLSGPMKPAQQKP